jgi:hypothetical protein
MTAVIRRPPFLAVSLVLLVAACGGSGSDAAGATAVPVTTGIPVTTTPAATTEPATPPTTEPDWSVGQWTAVPAGPGCMCSDGSAFEVWERPADPTKVVLFFEGGGACFSAETCGPGSPTYKRKLVLGVAPGSAGIFDATNPANPIADYSIVYVPYCTGDVHLGDNVQRYSDTVTIDHNGFPNADTGLQTVLADFPDVEQLLVAGSSAGSIPTPLFAGLAADVLPDTRIVTFGDSSAAYPDAPALNAAIGGLWGVLDNVPDWPVNAGLTPAQWSFPGLYVQSGTQHPDITFARFDYAYDRVQSAFASLAGIPADDLLAAIEGSEADIEAAGVPIASFIAPGTTHTILGSDGFYDVEVGGVKLVDFLATLVGGGVPADVRCVDCGRPS